MTCLLFNNESSATTAEAQIRINMGIPNNGGITEKWAEVKQRTDNSQWFIPMPEEQYMTNVEYDSQSEYQTEWDT